MLKTSDQNFPNYESLIIKFEAVRLNLKKNENEFLKIFPNAHSFDVRRLCFQRLGNLIINTNLAFIFIKDSLLPINNSWWQNQPYFKNFKELSKIYTIQGFDRELIKIGFLQSLFSKIEYHFRIFLRQLSPNACKGATSAFREIKPKLGAELGNFSDDFNNLTKLLSLSRNAIHNNGVFLPYNTQNDKVSYKGINYNFIVGENIDFITWDWLIEMTDDVRELFKWIVFHHKIISIKDSIADPFVTNQHNKFFNISE